MKIEIEIGDNLLSVLHHIVTESPSDAIGDQIKTAFGIDFTEISKQSTKDDINLNKK